MVIKPCKLVQQSRPAKFNIYTPPTLAGLFFCLASAEGAGLLFFPCYNTTPYKRLQWLLYHMCNYTAHAIKQRTRLYRRFSSDLPHSADVYTRPTQTAIIPPAQCWSISQYCSTSSAYQRPAPRRTLYSSAQTAYYNNVYKGAGVRHRYGSTPDGAAHRRPSKPGGAVQ